MQGYAMQGYAILLLGFGEHSVILRRMSVFYKIGGLTCVLAISGLGLQPTQEADACGFMMPPISFETGTNNTLPAMAEGVYVEISYQQGKSSSKDFEVIRSDANGKKETISVSLKPVLSGSGQRFLAFDRQAQAGESYSLRFQKGPLHKIDIAKESLSPAQNLSFDVKVDSKGNATVTAKADKSLFSNMWRYNLHYQGDNRSVTRSSQSYLNLCSDTSSPAGWQELAIEVIPSNKTQLATMVTRDVWVDCKLASEQSHPSISKASDEYFVPDIKIAGI